MPDSTVKNYSLFAIVLAVLLIVAGYMVMNNYWPKYNDSKLKLSQTEAEKASLEQALASVQTFLQNYDEQKDNASLVNLALPAKNSDLANFISSVADLAAASNVSLSNLTIGNANDEVIATTPNTIQIQDISFGASGTYLAFKDFMLRLENHLRLIDVDQVTLASSSSASPGTALLEYTIKLRTYFQQ